MVRTFGRREAGHACLHLRHHRGHLRHLVMEGVDGGGRLRLMLGETAPNGALVALGSLTSSFGSMVGVRRGSRVGDRTSRALPFS
jgi:hypothetical protein